ncbi:LOW QUALITY PROTEIN: uncharacterized protein V5649_008971 [Rhynchonycteris naso]
METRVFHSARAACTDVPSYDTASSGIFRESESVKVWLGSRQGLDQGGSGAWPFAEQCGTSDSGEQGRNDTLAWVSGSACKKTEVQREGDIAESCNGFVADCDSGSFLSALFPDYSRPQSSSVTRRFKRRTDGDSSSHGKSTKSGNKNWNSDEGLNDTEVTRHAVSEVDPDWANAVGFLNFTAPLPSTAALTCIDWEDFECILDPDTKKPDHRKEATDGEWEGSLTPNLNYKGKWKSQILDNPNYQGMWIHPEIDNPKYKPDPTICHCYNISILGLDLWQVKLGSIFDNFLFINDEEFAKEVGNKTIRKDVEKQWRELFEEMENRKKREEKGEGGKGKSDIWGTAEEGNEEDFAEEPRNDRQMKEVGDERAFLGKNEKVHVDGKNEL